MSRGDIACKVYVGDLDTRCDKKEVEDAFQRCGPIRNVWVARNPPGFAFVEFEDPRDAQDACKQMDGERIGNGRVKVEMSRGGRGGRGGGGRRSPRRSPPRRSPPRRSRGSPRYDRYSRSRSRSRDRRSLSPRDRRSRSR